MDNKKKIKTYYQRTQKKQAHLTSSHNVANLVLPFWLSLRGASVPKVSIDHQGFAGTITHMDGDDTEEKTERNTEFTYITTTIPHQQT